MREQKAKDIVLPFKDGMPLHPSVTMSDKIVHAIELMVKNDLKSIAVVHNKRPIGMIRLEDAFRKLGLQAPQKERLSKKWKNH